MGNKIGNNFFSAIFMDSRFGWLRHLLFILVLVLIIIPENGPISLDLNEAQGNLLFLRCGIVGVLLALFYYNNYILLPRFFFERKYSLFFAIIFGIAVILFILMWIGERIILGFEGASITWSDLPGFILLIFIYLTIVSSYRLFKSWLMGLLKNKELESNMLRLELEQLKSQVSPHFLFNTLNNIHLAMEEDPQKASEVLLSLSDILRYQLYEISLKEVILLSREIEVMKQIIHLESIRRDDFLVDFSVIGDTESIIVPTHLFIAFIENAVKHGSTYSGLGYHLKVRFEIKGKNLKFYCANPFSEKKGMPRDGGLGHQNIRKRLTLLFPGRHELSLTQNQGIFQVYLCIPILL